MELLPDGSAVVEMLSDYAVMREQARACHQISTDLMRKATVPIMAIPAK
jgi:hypothetical protein